MRLYHTIFCRSLSGKDRPVALTAGCSGPALRCSVVALFAFTALLAAATAGAEPKRINPHDFSNKEYCGICHRKRPPALQHDPVSTCTKCHMGNLDNHPVAGHPIGSVPRINVPSSWPLTKDKRMVCYTCHDYHAKTGYKLMLRVELRKVCFACHAGY